MRLLIADDNAEICSLLRRLCATVATDVRVCANGGEAVQTFREFQPDWTIMDIFMPQVDGIKAAREIIAAHPRARIIVLTQLDGPEWEAAARAAGACAFISKENLGSLLSLLSQSATSPANP